MRAKGGYSLWLAACLLLSGCLSFHHEAPRPGRTSFGAAVVTLPVQMVDNYLILSVKWDKFGPYHFIIDTGSSVTLVTPELAQRYAAKDALLPEMPEVPDRSADGQIADLPSTILSRLELGQARFADVPALVYDCSSFTTQLGVKIDGVLGFPLFRETLLTLDYPHGNVRLQARALTAPVVPGTAIPFNNTQKIPFIPVRLGEHTLIALIDSGNDEALQLNPLGLDPKYAFAPTQGRTVHSVTGDHIERIGRLADTLYIGDKAVPHPIVEVIDEQSALGGGILKYFVVTFDQAHDRVIFNRDSTDPIALPALRSVGLCFDRTPAYWRVVSVIPGTPASSAGIEAGDLVTAINGEPAPKWDPVRYDQLMANADQIGFTFLNGTRKTDHQLKVVELVP
jgi:hypothetical protein